MAFSDAQLEDLRERADMVALLGRRVSLQKTGRDHRGLCPFHGERTPSFYVVPNKRMWHCFGCGESGDVFKFFMKLDGLSFGEAVRQVAAESGYILDERKEDPEEQRRRAHEEELAGILERAVKFYEEKLWRPGGKPAREHLQKRGIQDEWARRFRLGFGCAGSEELSRALEKAGVPAELGIEAGLLIASSRGGRPFDRFHGRLLVPIRIPRPPHGRVVALGGRVLEGLLPERPGYKVAKYVNSPETPLYHKSHVLYGLDQARDCIRKDGRAIVVEGYFDVIGLHQGGVQRAVATCGTSLTEAHLDLLGRTGARDIVFLFDGDAAGLRAATKAAELCAKTQVPARAATLPDGLDPDDFVAKHGRQALEELLAQARPTIELLIDHALATLGPGAPVEERVRAVQTVAGIVRSAPAGLSRDLYVGQIASRLAVPEAAVREALVERPAPEARPSAAHAPHGARAGGAGHRAGPRHPGRATGPRERDAELGRDGSADGWVDEGPAAREHAGAASEDPTTDVPEPGVDPAERARLVREAAARAAAAKEAARRARRTYELEEVVVVSLLKFPQLAGTVAQEGILGDFGDPLLRSVADRVLGAMQAGEPVQAAALLQTVEDPAVRAELGRKLAAEDGGLEDYVQHLGRVLDRMRQEIRRHKARELLVLHQRGLLPDDDQARRDLLEQQQKLLEETRRLHLRKRERDGGSQ